MTFNYFLGACLDVYWEALKNKQPAYILHIKESNIPPKKDVKKKEEDKKKKTKAVLSIPERLEPKSKNSGCIGSKRFHAFSCKQISCSSPPVAASWLKEIYCDLQVQGSHVLIYW